MEEERKQATEGEKANDGRREKVREKGVYMHNTAIRAMLYMSSVINKI